MSWFSKSSKNETSTIPASPICQKQDAGVFFLEAKQRGFGDLFDSVLTLVCSKCGVCHKLASTSFLMSAQQALDQLTDSGLSVIHTAGASEQYIVSKLMDFPSSAWITLQDHTPRAFIEASEELKIGKNLTWICRTCGFDKNGFPDHWRGNDKKFGMVADTIDHAFGGLRRGRN